MLALGVREKQMMRRTAARRRVKRQGRFGSLKREMVRAKEAATRLYRRYPNVVGIGVGTKYREGRATGNHAAIQFYVRRKRSYESKGKRLPRVVYGRFKNGRINRGVRFVTDVIEVGRVKMTCEAGSAISASIGLTRQNGRVTFAFRNKAVGDEHSYILSCAHVLGDIDGDTNIAPEIAGECCPDGKPSATIVFSSSQVDQKVEFDIAIARVSETCRDVRDGAVVGTGGRIRSFMASDVIAPPLRVACALPLSNVKRAVVSSHAGSVSVEYRGGTYEVDNAWLMKADGRVVEGDSGGLIYTGSAGVGVVFASSETDEGWAWFHVLNDAFDFVSKQVELKMECFGP
jgi:hypothetical protein